MENIKYQLPHGAIKKIACRIQLAESTVSGVITGKRKCTRSSEILGIAAEIILETKTKEREAMEKLNAALNE